jgi:hypothetical protein
MIKEHQLHYWRAFTPEQEPEAIEQSVPDPVSEALLPLHPPRQKVARVHRQNLLPFAMFRQY